MVYHSFGALLFVVPGVGCGHGVCALVTVVGDVDSHDFILHSLKILNVEMDQSPVTISFSFLSYTMIIFL